MKSKVSRLERIMQILTALQSGKSYSSADLAKMFGTTRRTIFRDLETLKLIKVQFSYDPKTHGYQIDPDYFLPPVDFTLKEALSLLWLAHEISSQIQQPFNSSTLQAAMKIESKLPIEIKQYCNTAMETISARLSAQAPAKYLDNTFSQLQQAIRKKRIVNITYNSLFEREIIELSLSPYHLLYHKRAWYVLGFSSMHDSVRTFKLNRIKQLETTNKYFPDKGDFDLAEYLGRAWAMIREDRIYNIKLRFLPMVAENVTEVQWHPTQKVTRNEDGSATLEFRIDGLGEITWWILGYGDQVQVLAPKQLKNKIIQTARNMLKLNQQI